MLRIICGASSSSKCSELSGVLRAAVSLPLLSCTNNTTSGCTALQGIGASRGYFSDVSPTQKQQQLFSEMQSVRRMLLLQNPHFWHTEPYFWAHGAHLVPVHEKQRWPNQLWLPRSTPPQGPSDPELAQMIESRANDAMQQPQQQHEAVQRGMAGRMLRLVKQEQQHLAGGISNLLRLMQFTPGATLDLDGRTAQITMEMKNLIKIWRRLKMKKHKIRKRRKANRYKNA